MKRYLAMLLVVALVVSSSIAFATISCAKRDRHGIQAADRMKLQLKHSKGA